MKTDKKISVVVSAFNEEKKIKDCLNSVRWADEIIFVDNSSTDDTKKIASGFTSKIFTRENNLMLNVNKNFGFSKATGDWILCLDADEQIPVELKDEILSILSLDIDVVGYWIARKNIIFGKWIEHSGWFPDHQMRLFRRGTGKFQEQHVHEMIQVQGKTEYLKKPMIHNSYETIFQFLHKTITIYAPNEAKELVRKGYVFNYLDSLRFPVKEFTSRFFAREGYKDGFHGLMLSFFMAFYHFIVFSFIWEQGGFKKMESVDVLSDIETDSKKVKEEMSYWILKEKIKRTKNPLLKLLVKIKSKF